ncbi:hypothetical protein H6777_02975 [Candidatus Nomurabacteria bacterium]|nr:hypothetical protein [Candidatus Nomurabacteria bacterium]
MDVVIGISTAYLRTNYLDVPAHPTLTFSKITSARLRLDSQDPRIRLPSLARKGEHSLAELEDCLADSGGDIQAIKSDKHLLVVRYVAPAGYAGTKCKSVQKLYILNWYDSIKLIEKVSLRLKKQAVEQLLAQESESPDEDVGRYRFVEVVDDYNFTDHYYIPIGGSCAVGTPADSVDPAQKNGTMKEVGQLGGKTVYRYTPGDFSIYASCPAGVLFTE